MGILLLSFDWQSVICTQCTTNEQEIYFKLKCSILGQNTDL